MRTFLALLCCLTSSVAHADEDTPSRVHIVEHRAAVTHPTLGPANAPVTIEFFLNLSDGARTPRAHALLRALHKRHPSRLRIIYRLTPGRDSGSAPALSFGREAFEQGRFFPFLEAYYGKRRNHPPAKDYPKIARAAKINPDRVREAAYSMRHQDVLRANRSMWRRMHVANVPGILVNGQPLGRISTIEQLEQAYDLAYDRAEDLLSRGVSPEDLYQRLLEPHLDVDAIRISGPVDSTEPGEDPRRGPVQVRMTELLGGRHQLGSDDAPVTLVFICHLGSHYCMTMTKQLDLLREAYKDEVRIIYHPLFAEDRPGHERIRLMHEATLCASEQQAFWSYMDLAFIQQRRVSFDAAIAVELAERPGLDIDEARFQNCLETGRFSQQLAQDLAVGRRAGVKHTPSLVIGGLLYSGRLHFEELHVLVDAALADGLIGRLSQP